MQGLLTFTACQMSVYVGGINQEMFVSLKRNLFYWRKYNYHPKVGQYQLPEPQYQQNKKRLSLTKLLLI